jgi:hypothetical protein
MTKMNETQVVTYQSPGALYIHVAPWQEREMRAASVWPKDPMGREYATVSMGLHLGTPTDIDTATGKVRDE